MKTARASLALDPMTIRCQLSDDNYRVFDSCQ